MCLKEEVFIQLNKQTKKTEVNTNETIKADRIQSKCTINYAIILMSILGPRGVYRICVKDVQTFSFSHCCKLNRRYLDLSALWAQQRPSYCKTSQVISRCQAVQIQGPWRILHTGAVRTPRLALLHNTVYSGVFFCFFLNGSFKQVSPHEPFLKVPNNVWCGCDKL